MQFAPPPFLFHGLAAGRAGRCGAEPVPELSAPLGARPAPAVRPAGAHRSAAIPSLLLYVLGWNRLSY